MYKPKGAKVLDLGCGIGLTSILAQEYKNTVGCDIYIKSVKATKELLAKVGLKNKVVIYDGVTFPFRSNTLDAVTSLEVIEHAREHEVLLSEMARVLKKDGVLIVTTANKWWPIEPHFKLLFLSYLPSNLADFYVRLAKKGNSYENIKLPGYSLFRQMVEKHFTVEDMTLQIIKDYKKYSLDTERGYKVVLVGKMLQFMERLGDTPLSFLEKFTSWVLLRVSLGWVYLGRPKIRII